MKLTVCLLAAGGVGPGERRELAGGGRARNRRASIPLPARAHTTPDALEWLQ